MKVDNRWRERLAKDWLKAVEQFRRIKPWADAIRAKQQLNAIVGPLLDVNDLQALIVISGSNQFPSQANRWFDQALSGMRKLQERAAPTQLAHIAAMVREEIHPAEAAFVTFVRRYAGYLLSAALRDGDRDRVTDLLDEFSLDYELLQDLIGFSTCTEQQATQKLSDENDELQRLFKQTEEKLGRSMAGTTNRSDALDKAQFQAIAIKLLGRFRNIPELRQHPEMAWLPKDIYNDDTLKKWLKDACPDIKLSGGRPLTQKKSSKTSP